MGYILKNNAVGQLAGPITDTATDLTVLVGQGDRFPAIAAPNYTKVTIENAAGLREIVLVTARADGSNTLTIERGQEGTTPRAWAAGDIVELRLTAGELQKIVNDLYSETLEGKTIDLATNTIEATVEQLNAILGSDQFVLRQAAQTVLNKAFENCTFSEGVVAEAELVDCEGVFSTLQVTESLSVGGTGDLGIPAGATAQRTTPSGVAIRYNTSENRLEFCVGGVYAPVDAPVSVPEKATSAEAQAGTDNSKFITPQTLETRRNQWGYIIAGNGSGGVGDILVSAGSEAPPSWRAPTGAVRSVANSQGTSIHFNLALVLMEDGTDRSWGRTGSFSLGRGITSDVAVAVGRGAFLPALPAGVGIKSVETCSGGTFVVLENGHVYSCGLGTYGLLGHGNTNNQSYFQRIEALTGHQIDRVFLAGHRLTPAACSAYFLTTTKRLFACGYNAQGQLGLGNTTSVISTPQEVAGAFNNIEDVYCEADCEASVHIRLSNGDVFATGVNAQGQLGLGDTANRSAFARVNSLSNVVKLARTQGFWSTSGGPTGHVLALLANGDVYAAGYNGFGGLGLGDTTNRTTFVKIPSLSNIKDIGAFGGRSSHSWAATDSATTPGQALGQLWVWGLNNAGAVADGTTTQRAVPTLVTTGQSLVGSPILTPFTNSIKQVVSFAPGLGWTTIIVLTTDNRLFLAGSDTGGFAIGVNNKTIFTQIPIPRFDRSDEVVSSVWIQGIDAVRTLYAITNYGALYVAASSDAYRLATGGYVTASQYGEPLLQKVSLG